jgi:hypothetical protein
MGLPRLVFSEGNRFAAHCHLSVTYQIGSFPEVERLRRFERRPCGRAEWTNFSRRLAADEKATLAAVGALRRPKTVPSMRL